MISSTSFRYSGKWFVKVVYPLSIWLMLWIAISSGLSYLPGIQHPQSLLAFLNGVRSLSPFIAIIFSIVIIVSKLYRREGSGLGFVGPLGFLTIYGVIGGLATVLSPDWVNSLYWNLLYLAVPLAIWATTWNKDSISTVEVLIRVNWVLIALAFSFLLFLSAVYLDLFQLILDFPSLLSCNSIGSWYMFSDGVIRSTGVGRFAAITAIICFPMVWRAGNARLVWLLALLLCLILLLTTGARTSIVGLLVAVPLLALLTFGKHAIKIGVPIVLIMIVVLVVTGLGEPMLKGCMLKQWDAKGISYLKMNDPTNSLNPEENLPSRLEHPVLDNGSLIALPIISNLESDDSVIDTPGLNELERDGNKDQGQIQNKAMASTIATSEEAVQGLDIVPTLSPALSDGRDSAIGTPGLNKLERVGNKDQGQIQNKAMASTITTSEEAVQGLDIVPTLSSALSDGRDSVEFSSEGQPDAIGVNINGNDEGDSKSVISSQTDTGSYGLSKGSGVDKTASSVSTGSSTELQLSGVQIERGESASSKTGLGKPATSPGQLVDGPITGLKTGSSIDSLDIESPRALAPDPTSPKLTFFPTGFFSFNGRVVIWETGLGFIKQSIWLGYGFQADRWVLGTHMHNSILHSLIQAGLAGFIPFIAGLAYGWILMIKNIVSLSRLPVKHKTMFIQVSGVMIFLSIRSIFESTGAFFGIDWLLLAPMLVFLQLIYSNYNRYRES